MDTLNDAILLYDSGIVHGTEELLGTSNEKVHRSDAPWIDRYMEEKLQCFFVALH